MVGRSWTRDTALLPCEMKSPLSSSDISSGRVSVQDGPSEVVKSVDVIGGRCIITPSLVPLMVMSGREC